MGRSKTPSAPTYKTTELKYGDTASGKMYYDKASNSYVNQYYADPAEQVRKMLVQDGINDLILDFGKTAPEISKQYDDIEKAYVDDATKKFMDSYTPAVKSLQEDVASRFGTLNSSQFLDGINDLEKNRGSALADIINQGKQVKNDLYNQEETNKLNQLKSLSSILSGDQQNVLDTLQIQSGNNTDVNDYYMNQYIQQLNNYTADRDSKRKMLSSMVNSTVSSIAKVLSSGK